MDERNRDLCLYRLEKAEKCLASAKLLAQSEDYCGAVEYIFEKNKGVQQW